MGRRARREFVGERKYRSLGDFCNRVGSQLVNRKVMESFIRVGALDFTGIGRNPLLVSLEQYLGKSFRPSGSTNQLSLLDAWDEPKPPVPNVPEFSAQERLQQEKEYLGVYLSGHPLEAWKTKFRTNGVISLAELDEEGDGKEVLVGGVVVDWRNLTTRKGLTMAAFRLEDLTGSVEVVVFPKLYEKAAAGYASDQVQNPFFMTRCFLENIQITKNRSNTYQKRPPRLTGGLLKQLFFRMI